MYALRDKAEVNSATATLNVSRSKQDTATLLCSGDFGHRIRLIVLCPNILACWLVKVGINLTLLYDTPMPHDDSNEIAEYLIQQHGLDGAITVAMNNAY